MANRKYRDLEERLLANSVVDGECWFYVGKRNNRGYGTICVRAGGRQLTLLVHRLAYTVFTGASIPDGLEIDHICRNKHCINPAHLRPLPRAENLARREFKKAQASS